VTGLLTGFFIVYWPHHTCDVIYIGVGAAVPECIEREVKAGKHVCVIEAGSWTIGPMKVISPSLPYVEDGRVEVKGSGEVPQFTKLMFSTDLPDPALLWPIPFVEVARCVGGGGCMQALVWTLPRVEDFGKWTSLTADNVKEAILTMHARMRPQPSSFDELLTPALATALQQRGVPPVNWNNISNAREDSFFTLEFLTRHGLRWGTVQEFLLPVLDRVRLWTETEVVKIIFNDDLQAIGVECRQHGKQLYIHAREIRVGAGAVKSAALILASGIGRREQHQKFKVASVAVNEFVGTGKRHFGITATFGLDTLQCRLPPKEDAQFGLKEFVRNHTGFFAATGYIINWQLKTPTGPVLMEFIANADKLHVGIMVLAPRTTFEVELDPDDHTNVKVTPGALAAEDLAALITALTTLRPVMATAGLQPEHIPGPTVNLTAWIPENLADYSHHAATLPVSLPGQPGALNADRTLRGVRGVWVIDSSSMPDVPRQGTFPATAIWGSLGCPVH